MKPDIELFRPDRGWAKTMPDFFLKI